MQIVTFFDPSLFSILALNILSLIVQKGDLA